MEFIMTYGVTLEGFVIKPLLDILNDIEDYQLENVDPTFTRDRLSVIGQLNTANAQQISELWEVAESIYSNMFRDSASGSSLQHVAALTGTYLTAWSKTVVENVEVTLNPNKSLPIGSVANLSGQSDVRFVSLTEVTGSVIGGTFYVDFEAEEYGAIEVAIGQLNEIAEAQSGWISVNNTEAGITGTQPESDSELRIKSENALGSLGSTTVDAIKARIINNTTVSDCRVVENDDDLIDENLLPPHHIWVVALGGTNQEITEEIFLAKAAGIGTFGNIDYNVQDSQGNIHQILFSRPEEILIDVTFICAGDEEGLPVSGEVANNCIDNVTNFLNSFGVGEDVAFYSVLCIIQNTLGVFTITGLEIEGNSVTIDTTTVTPYNDKIPIAFNEIAKAGDIIFSS
jgi:hypothetical protein